jgi:hypothetical protein
MMSNPAFDRPPAAVPLDRETLLARFDGIRQFAQGGRRAPNKPLLLLYALARLKHNRQAEIRFNTTEAALQPLHGIAPGGGYGHSPSDVGRVEQGDLLFANSPLPLRKENGQIPKTPLEALVEREPRRLEVLDQTVGDRRRRGWTTLRPPTRHRLARVERQRLLEPPPDHRPHPGSPPAYGYGVTLHLW